MKFLLQLWGFYFYNCIYIPVYTCIVNINNAWTLFNRTFAGLNFEKSVLIVWKNSGMKTNCNNKSNET